jgi:hypothetical protein
MRAWLHYQPFNQISQQIEWVDGFAQQMKSNS